MKEGFGGGGHLYGIKLKVDKQLRKGAQQITVKRKQCFIIKQRTEANTEKSAP